MNDRTSLDGDTDHGAGTDNEPTEGDPSESDLSLIRKTVIGIAVIMFAVAGVAMLFLWFGAMIDWLGFVGGVLAVVLGPIGSALFPFIYWGVEGSLPGVYLLLWGVGLIGMTIGYLAADFD